MQHLKKKIQLNYRPGTWVRQCDICDYFVPDFEVRDSQSGSLQFEGRCSLVGLRNDRRLRVQPHFVCDRFSNTQRIARFNRPWPC
ncbi:hypothetical protein [Desulfolithobacter dissulfuricans]|uniref:hypothetical protein n=1 Tax=Desulfolithobacter dissulfuricans TaxID=2795293 RepID=UPI0022787EB0|nr:hypothetical protein [Desulfolithobacter dissulfuricans]